MEELGLMIVEARISDVSCTDLPLLKVSLVSALAHLWTQRVICAS